MSEAPLACFVLSTASPLELVMDPYEVFPNEDGLESEETGGRRYRAAMCSDVLLLDLDWDAEPEDAAAPATAALTNQKTA
jgi:hypothetical protein